ncbi:hypothetical protein NMD1_01611 [Novosphingobium sp. MD-1]|nr:hypothetical protein NMD1_01611 [Novosphingobium sp. MD-1]
MAMNRSIKRHRLQDQRSSRPSSVMAPWIGNCKFVIVGLR